MIGFLDAIFVALSGAFGWFAAAIMAALCAVVVLRPPSFLSRNPRLRRLTSGLALLLCIGFAAPPSLVALRPQAPAGPFSPAFADLTLPRDAPDAYPGPIFARLWYPAAEKTQGKQHVRSCEALGRLPLARDTAPARVILYAPHFRGPGYDNSARLSYLASHGYIIVAFNDVWLDPPVEATPEEEAARLHDWPFATDADYARTLALNDARVRLQAAKALAALDRLGACAKRFPASPWSDSVNFDAVGFLGYSIGGAAAAEAATMDSRIAAVVNLDGDLFGQALAGKVRAPYLDFTRDYPVPDAAAMNAPSPQERYPSRLLAREFRERINLAARPGSAGVRILRSDHSSFSDAALEPHLSRTWILDNPINFYSAINLYTRDFFDVHLKGRKPALLDRERSILPSAATYKEKGFYPGGPIAMPPLQE